MAAAPARGGEAEPDPAEQEAEYRAALLEGARLLREADPANPDAFRSTLATARSRFKHAQNLNRFAAAPYFWIALALADSGRYANAVYWAEKAEEYGQGRLPDALLLHGQLLLFMADPAYFDEAERLLWDARRLYAQASDRWSVYGSYLATFNLARVLYHRGAERRDYVDALGHAEAVWNGMAAAIRPDDPFFATALQALRYKAYCHDALDQVALALAAYERVLEFRPDDADIRLRMAVCYRRAGPGGEERAERELRAILARNDRDYEAELQLAHLYATRQPPARPEAEMRLRRFLDLAPRDHPWYARARRYVEGDREAAR